MSSPTTSAPVESAAPAAHSSIRPLLESLRPTQWVKNGFVFAALIFSRGLENGRETAVVAAAAGVFCALSSAVYLVNDVFDVAEDRQHPLKRLRPVASGRLAARTATLAAVLLALIGFTFAWMLDRQFFLVAGLYACLNLAYSAGLKRIPLLDVFIVAAGFVLRVIAGGLVIHVALSDWLIVCTTLLALFLALTKRRHEVVLLGQAAVRHRVTLVSYSPQLLDQLIAVVTACTVMSYALYTLSADVRAKFPGKRLELTIPFVLFGIFRYLYLVHERRGGGNPTRMLLTDAVLLAVVLLWAASVVLIIYL
ncbi:MAG TPA: decaprenyl-phosphate phosphoribosyltransferase [Terriglobia bacterium]|nr:decaprenyl-phosphate phosphoribosyltransferase [Terriglobia bacterium]